MKHPLFFEVEVKKYRYHTLCTFNLYIQIIFPLSNGRQPKKNLPFATVQNMKTSTPYQTKVSPFELTLNQFYVCINFTLNI